MIRSINSFHWRDAWVSEFLMPTISISPSFDKEHFSGARPSVPSKFCGRARFGGAGAAAGKFSKPCRCSFNRATRQLISFNLSFELRQSNSSHTCTDSWRRDQVGLASIMAWSCPMTSGVKFCPEILTPVIYKIFPFVPSEKFMGHAQGLRQGRQSLGDRHV